MSRGKNKNSQNLTMPRLGNGIPDGARLIANSSFSFYDPNNDKCLIDFKIRRSRIHTELLIKNCWEHLPQEDMVCRFKLDKARTRILRSMLQSPELYVNHSNPLGFTSPNESITISENTAGSFVLDWMNADKEGNFVGNVIELDHLRVNLLGALGRGI